MEGRTKLVFLSLFFNIIGLFGLIRPAQAAPDHLVINQVQITGGSGQTGNDFIELFNPTSAAFDLKGCRLIKRSATANTDTNIKSWTESTIIPPYSFYLWASSSFSNIPLTPDTTTSQTLSDNNAIALRLGAIDTGQIIDSLAWGEVTNNLAETAPYPTNPAANQSLIRKTDAAASRQDTNNNATDFTLSDISTPHNSLSAPEQPTATNQTIVPSAPITPIIIYQTPTLPDTPQVGDIVINELVSDPTNNSQEWIELYNRTDHLINLDNFSLSDGNGTKTPLNGNLGTNNVSRFYVLYSPKGNLNNSGDMVTLRYNETIIDQVTYGNWNDGNLTDNAPAISDPYALGRSVDGWDSNNDLSDFVKTEPTPGSSNKPAGTTTNDNITDNTHNKNNALQFNELYPNPPLNDLGEFIELVNLSDQDINLDNWTLADETSSYIINSTQFSNTIIKAQSFFLLPRTITNIILENSGREKITLTSPDQTVKLSLNYQGPVREGTSYARDKDGNYYWTTKPTPNLANVIEKINQPPKLNWDVPADGTNGQVLIFDASDSFDPEGSNLTFLWNFGEGETSNLVTPSHAYAAAKKYTVQLTVTDKQGFSSTDQKTITITDNTTASGKVAGLSNGPIYLTELMPNPTGSDNAEWLELYNPNTTNVSTAGWQLIINNKRYPLPNLEITAGDYLTLNKPMGNFTLPNNNAVIALQNTSLKTTSSLKYNSAPAGLSYALENNNWIWTNTPTPGETNIISQTPTNNAALSTDISQLPYLDSGTKVITQGIVTSPPGAVAKNIFFIAEQGNGQGIQIYLSGTIQPPVLNLGDVVRLTGSISHTLTSGNRLLVKKDDTIQKITTDQPEPAKEINLGDLTDDNEGQLIKTSGIVTKINSSSFAIQQDDVTLTVALKNRTLNWPKLNKKDSVSILGLVIVEKNFIKLWPRSPDDIETTVASLPSTTNDNSINTNLNSLTTDNSTIPLEKNSWLGYALLSTIILVLAGSLVWQKYQLAPPLEIIKNWLFKPNSSKKQKSTTIT